MCAINATMRGNQGADTMTARHDLVIPALILIFFFAPMFFLLST
jgi:hypothetical protein